MKCEICGTGAGKTAFEINGITVCGEVCGAALHEKIQEKTAPFTVSQAHALEMYRVLYMLASESEEDEFKDLHGVWGERCIKLLDEIEEAYTNILGVAFYRE